MTAINHPEGDPETLWTSRLRTLPDVPRRIVDATEGLLVALYDEGEVTRNLRGEPGWIILMPLQPEIRISVMDAVAGVLDLDAGIRDRQERATDEIVSARVDERRQMVREARTWSTN